MREIKYIVVHCTAGPQNQTTASIKSFWKNSLGWENVGYHIIVNADGTYERLSPDDKPTNGVAGYNSNSIHISYKGGVDSKGRALDNRTDAQKKTLINLLKQFKKKYPTAKIMGHRDFSPDNNKNGKIEPFEYIKICPSFDAITEYKNIK